MQNLRSISLDSPKVPKYFKKMSQMIMKLTRKRDLEKLRIVRDRETKIKLAIYHHSQGTDSYFCDKVAKYFTWEQVTEEVQAKTLKGEYTMTVVLPYKSGVVFTRGMANQAKYN